MVDVVDEANDLADWRLAQSLKNRKPEAPAGHGRCLSPKCGEPVPAGRRWCSAECRDDWEAVRR